MSSHRVRKTSLLTLALALAAALSHAETPPAAVSVSQSHALVAPLSRGETLDLPPLDEHLPSPAAFLGYPLGARFTPWDRIVSYLEALDAASPRVKMWEYGHSYEGRPLKLLAISSPDNVERLEEIRTNVQRLADPTGLSGNE